MTEEEMRIILSGLVRVGTVTNVDRKKRKVRVKFQSEKLPSGWLWVLQWHGAELYIKPDGEHTHTISDTFTGRGSASTIPDHNHAGSYLTYWMPKVNDTVLCLYIPVHNGDGFVLGGISSWQ